MSVIIKLWCTKKQKEIISQYSQTITQFSQEVTDIVDKWIKFLHSPFLFTLVFLFNINKIINQLLSQLRSFINDVSDFLLELDINQVYIHILISWHLLEIEL